MTMQSPSRAARIAALLGLVAALAACSSSEDRARDHVAKARAYLAENRRAEAKLELRSALRFDPLLVEAHNNLAKIELVDGNVSIALTHMSEAYRLDPTDSEAVLQLASTLQGINPDQSEALIEGVIVREPKNAAGYIGRSKFALLQGRIQAAAVDARRAMRLAPDDPRTDWHYGTVMQAVIRKEQLMGEDVEDSARMSVLSAFQRYIEKGGPVPWAAQIEQARVLAAWPGFSEQASGLFRFAVERTLEEGSAEDQLAAVAQAVRYARSVRDDELLEWALELKVELKPQDAHSWRQLADLRSRTRRDPQEVWDRALTQQADNPQLHLEYARFLTFKWRLDDALAHLQSNADEGVDPPLLLSAVASTQLAAGRGKDAARTIARLEQQHPNHPRTVLGRAQLDLREGKVRRAVANLTHLVEQYPDPDAYRLIARAHEVSNDPDAALAAIEKAIESRRRFNYDDQSTRARLLAANGRWSESISQLFAMREHTPLSDAELVLLARCQYENGQTKHARKALEDLLAKREPNAEAVLEYARREGLRPGGATLARRTLEALLSRSPQNWAVIVELTRLDLAAEQKAEALARLDRVVAANGDATPGRIRLLRARVSAETGREAGTIQDARLAFESQPRLRGALELLVALYVRKSQIDEAVAATEEARRVGAFDQDRRLLLGRLYRVQGHDAKALATFQAALKRDASDPSLYYEMGLSLKSLDRADEAVAAFEKALSIDTNFPEANDARRALEGTRSAGAS